MHSGGARNTPVSGSVPRGGRREVGQRLPGDGDRFRDFAAAGRHAFSLIELLVVVAILSTLAGMLFPALARARAHAQRQSCVANLRQLSMALTLYAQDFDENLPTFRAEPRDAVRATELDYWHDRFCAGLDLAPGERCWAHFLGPYVRADRLFFCPADGKTEERPVTSYEYKPGLARDPAIPAIEHPSSVAAIYEPWSYHLERQSEYSSTAAGNVAFPDGHVAWRRFSESTSARYHGRVDLHWLHPHNTLAHPCDGRDFVP